MQMGLCVNMVAQDASGVGMDKLRAVAEAGYDFVELPVMRVMALGDADFTEQVRRPLKDSGFACKVMNSFSAPDLRMTGPGAPLGAVRDYTCRALERAALLGARVIVVGSGASRAIAPDYPREAGLAQLLEMFAMMGKEAAAHGVTMAVEPLNRGETNVINTLKEAADVVRMVNHPHVKLLVDYYHFALGNEPVERVRACAGDIVHVHFARLMGRQLPMDAREDAQYSAFLQALKEGGYDAGISMEAFCDGAFLQRAQRALQVVRALW
nr:sugar phosphate isomerase/epimerase family protein [Maliibacterium massiliense]